MQKNTRQIVDKKTAKKSNRRPPGHLAKGKKEWRPITKPHRGRPGANARARGGTLVMNLRRPTELVEKRGERQCHRSPGGQKEPGKGAKARPLTTQLNYTGPPGGMGVRFGR